MIRPDDIPEDGRDAAEAACEITHGVVFPPRDEWDVAAYDGDEIVEGYRDHNITDPAPGDNRSPAYRWGWTNARRDASHQPDGFEAIRYAYIRMSRMMQ